MQIRRWIKRKAIPGLLHRKAIDEGIKRIEKEVPDVIKEGGWWTGEPIPEEKKAASKKVKTFFNEIMQKADPLLQKTLTQEDYFEGFQEWLFAAKKLGVNLPKI